MPPADRIVTVSELNRLARQRLESGFPLLWVAGEISNLTRAASGHIYFSLKDANAQVRCVMYRMRAQRVDWRLENGQQVEAQALVGLYEPRGDFQLGIESLRRAGLGQRFEALTRLTAKLAAEGLFAAERKRPLPRFPATIALVTSPQAAALQDVAAALRRRAPHLHAILFPVLVQGDGAAAGIAQAIIAAGHHPAVEAVLVIRGGGSIEDLWAFNEEAVARAIAACARPVVSGVGHETDTTLADHAADVRAATPTAAAEIITQGWHQAITELRGLHLALRSSLQDQIDRHRQRLDQLAMRLVHPATRLARLGDRLDMLGMRLGRAAQRQLQPRSVHLTQLASRLERARPRPEAHRAQLRLIEQGLRTGWQSRLVACAHKLAAVENALHLLNPSSTLERGFAIVRDAAGKVVTDAAQLPPGSRIELTLARGALTATVVTHTASVVSPPVRD